MNHWDEIRTAAHVARLGTISAASEALGVHRATVTRHIDMLEKILSGKLFLRHARGFTPTELGAQLLRVAEATDEQFDQLFRHAKGQADEISGELIITSLDSLGPILLPVINVFNERYPNVRIRFLSSSAVLKLEYGEAHVAFRAGKEPRELDNVVQLFQQNEVGLYATEAYISKHGRPASGADYKNHRFVGLDQPNSRIPFYKWMVQNVPRENVVFVSNRLSVIEAAVMAGTGIGFLMKSAAEQRDDLVEIHPPLVEWSSNIWIVTHVDLHRTKKVQAFLNVLKEVRGQHV